MGGHLARHHVVADPTLPRSAQAVAVEVVLALAFDLVHSVDGAVLGDLVGIRYILHQDVARREVLAALPGAVGGVAAECAIMLHDRCPLDDGLAARAARAQSCSAGGKLLWLLYHNSFA